MGNCNKCDLGIYDENDEIDRSSLNYQNNNDKNKKGPENISLGIDIQKYKKFEPEIIFLQMRIRKLLLNKKQNPKEKFYNEYYKNNNDNDNMICLEEQNHNLNNKNNNDIFYYSSSNPSINYPKQQKSEKYKSYSQKYNSMIGEDSNDNTYSGNISSFYLNNNNKLYRVENYKINNATYTGNMLNGKQHGYGIQKWGDGAKYEGEWENGKICGYGIFYHSDGDIYKGYWKNDKANGKGIYISIDGVKYEGQWINDTQDGYGIETWDDGYKYKGNYKNDMSN